MSKIFETLLGEHSNSEKILIRHRNFKVKYKDIFKSENIDLKKINCGDVVALIGDYNSFTIKIFLKLPFSFSKSTVKFSLNLMKLEKSILSKLMPLLKLNSFFLYISYICGEKMKLKNKDKIIDNKTISIIGFLISFIDNPIL